MRIAFFDTKPYDKPAFDKFAGEKGIKIKYYETKLNEDTVELANKYGTPLYVLDENDIRNNCRQFKDAFDKYYDGNAKVYYASKAFSCKEMYRIVNCEGVYADVVSGGELYTALSAGFPAENIGFHGNNKTPEELSFALDSGVGRIIVDNIFELHTLNSLAKEKGVCQKILLRPLLNILDLL